jgi:hypothetical protein
VVCLFAVYGFIFLFFRQTGYTPDFGHPSSARLLIHMDFAQPPKNGCVIESLNSQLHDACSCSPLRKQQIVMDFSITLLRIMGVRYSGSQICSIHSAVILQATTNHLAGGAIYYTQQAAFYVYLRPSQSNPNLRKI